VYYHFAQGAKGQELQAAASKALRFYEEAEAIEPQPWIQISGEMGYLYSALNQYPKAREHFQRYLEVDKHSAFAQRIKEDLSKLQGLK
jgi:tetratricopeptide (TPR) repeat protein